MSSSCRRFTRTPVSENHHRGLPACQSSITAQPRTPRASSSKIRDVTILHQPRSKPSKPASLPQNWDASHPPYQYQSQRRPPTREDEYYESQNNHLPQLPSRVESKPQRCRLEFALRSQRLATSLQARRSRQSCVVPCPARRHTSDNREIVTQPHPWQHGDTKTALTTLTR